MKRPRATLLTSVISMLVAAVLVAGCGGDGGSGSSGEFSSELISGGTLTVGSDVSFPPFEFGEAPDYDGFDVDLVKRIAADLGLGLEIQNTSIDTIISDVAQDEFDLAASALTITADSEREVDFSDPYYEVELALLVPRGSVVKSAGDLGGLTVGALDGTTGLAFADSETNAGRVRGFPSQRAAIAALEDGRLDAVVIDQPDAQELIDRGQSGLTIVDRFPTGEMYGLAFSPESPALLAAVNESLASMKEDGRLNDIYLKWFKIDAPEGVIDGSDTSG